MPFTGNPLAVFPDAEGLASEQMQRIARELNLPETAFVLPSAGAGDFVLRIFTPVSELPFAGHPTIGTALVLASTRRVVPTEHGGQIVFQEGAGLVPVSLGLADGALRTAWLTAPQRPEEGPDPPPASDVAAALSLATDDLDQSGPGPVVLSAGNPFLFVPLRSREAIGRARAAPVAWERALAGLPVSGAYMFCHEAESPGADLRARLFAPHKGIPEDPATGSAAAALPGYLLSGTQTGNGTYHWGIEQGVEMGRPSLIKVEADVRSGTLLPVRVGGSAVMISEGVMNAG